MKSHRIERDTMGSVRVPIEALWGAQTARALENFPVSGLRAHPALIRAYMLIKKSAAVANLEAGLLDSRRAKAIAGAVDEVLGTREPRFQTLRRWCRLEEGIKRDALRDERARAQDTAEEVWVSDRLLDQFVVDIFQAGAGTSFHMNCNEVLASLANEMLGGRRGDSEPIHPNDHVNMSQSTNDTYPTATRVATLLMFPRLVAALRALESALDEKAGEFSSVAKSGRTHLQDAVPITLGQEFGGWARSIERATRLVVGATEELRELGIGGTATGTGVNAPPGFGAMMTRLLSHQTSLELVSVLDLRESMQSQLVMTSLSGALRNLSIELGRIANDLRLLASGPTSGFAEIRLPPVQPGSSIMPGKVNPSLPECLNQICFRVIGADASVAAASGAGQLELNVMMPLITAEVLFSIEILSNFLPVFVEKCVRGIEADRERCRDYVEKSPALATLLNPLIGYERAARLAKESAETGASIRALVRREGLMSDEEFDELLARGGGGAGSRNRDT